MTELEGLTLPRALAVGACQTLALVPGVSRSGATIVGGLLLGLDRAVAAEFSFFLAMPTIAGAFVHDLLEVRDQLTTDRALEIAIGFVAAFVSAALVIRPFLRYVTRAGFAPFAWYRIARGRATFCGHGGGMACRLPVAAAPVHDGPVRGRAAARQRVGARLDIRYH